MTAAGVGAPSSSSLQQTEERRRCVADGDDRARQVAAATDRPRPPSASFHALREIGNGWIVERADHLIVCRQARARNSVRHHLRVAQDRRAGLESGTRALGETSDIMISRAISTMPVAWMIAHRDRLRRALEARQIGFGADDRKRVAVDLGAIANVRACCGHRQFSNVFQQ